MDLVERLRNYYSEDAQSYCTTHTICDEAADEIERLRSELAKCGKDNCMGRLTPGTTTWVTWEAREDAVAKERERCAKLCDDYAAAAEKRLLNDPFGAFTTGEIEGREAKELARRIREA